MKRLIALPISVALFAAACAGTTPDEQDVASLDTTVVVDDSIGEASDEPEPVAGGASAADSVVRVVTTGTFVSPEFGQLDSVAGSGSAFIIDETGLAVTNNHVVAGAASVEVFFDGSDEPVAATVVANSECSDLAVIDLAGDGYSALDWSSDETDVGLGIRAAGYPDGNPGLTLTGGIIARIENDGATPWASITSLLRHDAELAPGNSGGPILDENGAIVGVNVAASDAGRFAIPTSVAEPIVDSLRSGVDVDSIGLNAVAVLDEVTNESGVWVVSVEAGSPAAAAGIQPGDVITRMKGVRVGRDATLADYCSVVRSSGDGELPIELTRDNQFFAGSVRGAAAMSRVLNVTDDVVDTATAPPPAVTQTPEVGTPYVAFETVTDDSGTISMDVPSDWSDQRTTPVFIGGADRPAISASYNFDELEASINIYNGGTYDQPGVTATAFHADIDIEVAFDVVMMNLPWMYDCEPLERETFEDDLYTGVMQPFMDCAGTSSTVFSIAIKRGGEPGWLLMNIFAPTISDLEAAAQIASSFTLNRVPTLDSETDVDRSERNDTAVADEQTPNTAPDTPDTTPATTAPTVEEAAPELPETLGFGVEIVTVVGAPPMAESPTQTDVDGLTMVSYPTAASEAELRTWIDERVAATGCTDPVSDEAPFDEVTYAVACLVSEGASTTALGVALGVDPAGNQVVVTVVDIDAG